MFIYECMVCGGNYKSNEYGDYHVCNECLEYIGAEEIIKDLAFGEQWGDVINEYVFDYEVKQKIQNKNIHVLITSDNKKVARFVESEIDRFVSVNSADGNIKHVVDKFFQELGLYNAAQEDTDDDYYNNTSEYWQNDVTCTFYDPVV